jgi:outer membrane protein assembly factor BamB
MQHAHHALTWLVVAGLGCGARTGLEARDSGPALVDTGRCGAAVAPGSVVWQLDLPADVNFSGPRAADADGVTYFLGTPVGPNPRSYSLVAVDACGAVLWRTDDIATDFNSGARPTMFVNRDQVVVQWGAVDSFDRSTGARRWNVSIRQYSIRAGFGDPFGNSWASVGPSAATRDGSVFLSFQTSTAGHQLLAISPTGDLSLVAALPRQNDGTPISLIVDRAGQLDVLLNTSLAGALVRSYSTRGTPLFATSFPCVRGFLGGLASGTDFILMQTAPCVLTLRGDRGLSFAATSESFSTAAIDAQNNLYLGGTSRGLRSVDARGRVRWDATASFVVGGPVLGAGRRVFVAEQSSATDPINLVALDGDTGIVLWRRDFAARASALGGIDLLLTPPGQLVSASQNHVVSVASGSAPSSDAPWPTPKGGFDQRRAATGQ